MKANENFRFLKGYENYLIGDQGTIFSLLKRKEIESHDLKGYRQAQLITDRKEMVLVHRLVALAFVPREEGKNYVDHIDGNRSNNFATNLRWCTRLENDNYELAIVHKRDSAIARKGKAVIQYDLDGNEIARFRGQNEAGRITGISGANISQVCNHKRATAGGYIWRYDNGQ